MSDTVIWVTDDCLRPGNPALLANPGSPALFVFDDADLKDRRCSLKRIVFVYECLLQMPVVVRRGDVASQVAAFAAEHGATRIVTADSVGLRFAETRDVIRKVLPAEVRLEIVPVQQFVPYEDELELRRFSRYWSTIRHVALRK